MLLATTAIILWLSAVAAKNESCAEPPPKAVHAVIEIVSTPERKFARYICSQPYVLEGSAEINCTSGRWNGTVPKCKDSRCYLSDLLTLDNVAEGTPVITPSGHRLEVVCSEGHTPDEEIPFCQNGTWTNNSSPACREKMKCKRLKETGLLTIHYTEDRKIGSFAFFDCSAPGERSGVPFARCLENEVWSEAPPMCLHSDDGHEKTTVEASPADLDNDCSCTYDYNPELLVATSGGNEEIAPGKPVKRGEAVSLSCRSPTMVMRWQNEISNRTLQFSDEVNLTCDACEGWTKNELPTCEFEQAGSSSVVYTSQMNLVAGGVVAIAKGTSLQVRCTNRWVQPVWHAGQREGVRFKNDSVLSYGRKVYYMTYMFIDEVDDEHAGTYSCYAADPLRVYESTTMEIKNFGKEKTEPASQATTTVAPPTTTCPPSNCSRMSCRSKESFDANGCSYCNCIKPLCEGHPCPEGSRCSIGLRGRSDYYATNFSPIQPICVQVKKPGTCPPVQQCGDCKHDGECYGYKSCCKYACDPDAGQCSQPEDKKLGFCRGSTDCKPEKLDCEDDSDCDGDLKCCQCYDLKQCVPPAERCSLKPITSFENCYYFYNSWYYDPARNDCFLFAGVFCKVNSNRFEAKEECLATCKK